MSIEKKILFVLIYIVAIYNSSFAQLADFNVSASTCLNENIGLVNNSTGAVSYNWDFCLGDFNSSAQVTDVVSLTSGTLKGIELIYDEIGDEWYGFVIISTKLIRLRFGDSFSNIPVIDDLGTLSGTLSNSSEAIVIEKNSNGNWVGFIGHLGIDYGIVRINFGPDLTSTPTAENIGDLYTGRVRGMDLIYELGNYYLITTTYNYKKLAVLNLGNSLENSFSGSDISVFGDYSVLNLPTGITAIKKGGEWLVYVVSQGNGNLTRFNFGTDFASAPIQENNFSGILTSAKKIRLYREGLTYYGVIGSDTAPISIWDLEDLSPTSGATQISQPNLPISFAFDVIDSASVKYLYSVNSGVFKQAKFEVSCDASIAYSEEIEPDIWYTGSGVQEILLTAYDAVGSDNIAVKSVSVSSDIAPIISITSDNTFCTTSVINFTSSSSTSGLTYTWDFGDGSPTSGDANPAHTYSTAGEYEVTLSVEDGTCGNFTRQTITIYDEPAPDFLVPGGNICTNQPYIFENITPGDYGDLITYGWELDGDPISSDQNLDITFSTGGTKELKLIASIPGCDIEIAKNLTNVKEGTLPIFSFDDSCVGEEVVFTNSTSGDITDVNWEFSNGFTSTLSSPTMVFDAEGTYDATLYITNADGCETFDTRTITIHALPVVDFSNELACEALSTQFEDLSTVNIDNLSSWRWDFGDGTNFSEEQNASHIFSSNGDYEVELLATSSFGCVDSLTKTVTVLKAPEVAFDFDKICLDVPIQFTDASAAVEGEEITDWSWNLGGTFSAQQNPQISFENPLDYSISLTVTSSNLCTATQTQLISIPEIPTLDFSLVDDCENETAQITDVTDITGDNISNRSWSINGSQVSSETNFEYDFAQSGSYNVTLSVDTENGCEYETSRPVTIHPVPTASFSTSFDFGAPPFVVDFTNQSSGAQSYSWEFEEGAVSDDLNPSYTFNNLGEFDVSLVAISDQNCTDTISNRIQVLEPLLDAEVLNFNILPTATGDKLSFAIRNNGTIRLDSLYVTVNLGGELEIYETINKAMNPNEVISAQLALTIDNKRLDYICIDVSPFISNYQDVDEDNNRSCITFGQETFIISNPYPNPSKSLVAFDIIATKDATADVELLSADGDLINTFSAQVYQGNNRLDFDLSKLKSGLYFLKVKLDGQNKVHRLVINN